MFGLVGELAVKGEGFQSVAGGEGWAATMRTALLIALGLLLAGSLLLFKVPAQRRVALFVFLPVWLVFCVLNLRTGLSHGYTLAQELPIHLALFAVPAAFALGLSRAPKPRAPTPRPPKPRA